MVVKLIWSCNIMTNYKQFSADNVQNASVMNIVNLTTEQWNKLKVFHKQPAGYGREYQFYGNEKALMESTKRITLNGAPLRVSTDVTTQVIGKVPDGAEKGNLVVLSKSVLSRAGIAVGGIAGVPTVRSDL